MDCADNEGGT